MILLLAQSNNNLYAFNTKWINRLCRLIKKNKTELIISAGALLFGTLFYIQNKKINQQTSEQNKLIKEIKDLKNQNEKSSKEKKDEITKLQKEREELKSKLQNIEKNHVTPDSINSVANLTIETTNENNEKLKNEITTNYNKIEKKINLEIQKIEKRLLTKFNTFVEKQEEININSNNTINLAIQQVKEQKKRLERLELKFKDINQKIIKNEQSILEKQQTKINNLQEIIKENNNNLKKILVDNNSTTNQALTKFSSILQSLEEKFETRINKTNHFLFKNHKHNLGPIPHLDIYKEHPSIYIPPITTAPPFKVTELTQDSTPAENILLNYGINPQVKNLLSKSKIGHENPTLQKFLKKE